MTTTAVREHTPRSGRPPGERYRISEAAKATAASNGGTVDLARCAADLGLDARHVRDRLLSYRRIGKFPRDVEIPSMTEACVKCGVESSDTGKGDAYGYPGRLCRTCYRCCKSAKHREMAKRFPVGKEKIATRSEAEANRLALLAEIEAAVETSEKEWKEKKSREHRTNAEGSPKVVAAECLAEWRRARKRTKALSKGRKAS